MKFYADLHIHSRFSRATSGQCDFPHLHRWARRKGLSVVGTGDFTHPAWFEEAGEALVEAEEGLYRLRDDLAAKADAGVPASCRRPVRFLYSAEISNIYKKDGRTRKNHNLVLAPDRKAADAIRAALGRIGNVRSDGRPILGLDARDLLETVLEKAPGAFLVPAHVWTPWFSLFGSKSGFDALEECFGDLSDRIFALETGLSSDPPMNWRLSALDRFSLVSHSDAHSPENLAREADVFDAELSFPAIRRALETRQGFLGTLEFFPEEGKYHLDGHRACSRRMTPAETRAAGGLCPACGKPVTVGVLSRVEALADRPGGRRPERAPAFRSVVPLPEVLAECLGSGPGSKKVTRAVETLVESLGPELDVLLEAGLDAIATAGGALAAEAIRRVRAGDVRVEGGYDGEYGTVGIFGPGERERIRGQSRLFDLPAPPPSGVAEAPAGPPGAAAPKAPESLPLFSGRPAPTPAPGAPEGLNPEQREVVEHGAGPIRVAAGPGTGKTLTVAHRLARLVREGLARPAEILAVTFTNQAAREMRERICGLLGPASSAAVAVSTFHAFCARFLRDRFGTGFEVVGEEEVAEILAAAAPAGKGRRGARKAAERVSEAKREGLSPEEAEADPRFGPEVAAAYRASRAALEEKGALDFDDLILETVHLLRRDPAALDAARAKCRWLFVDEYQDVNAAQVALVRLLAPPGANVCAVGDPDQAIYGFRGASPRFFRAFAEHWPGAKTVRLSRNYRSPDTVLEAAADVLERSADGFGGKVVSGIEGDRISIAALATSMAEAEFVAHEIEKEMGGVSFFSRDSERVGDGARERPRAFSDFAVLARTEAAGEAAFEALERLGIPCRRAGARRWMERPGVREAAEALKAAPGARAGTVAAALLALAGELPGDAAAAARELAPVADGFGTDLAGFLEHLSLSSEVDALDPRADRVSCLTMHAAKGLEFPVVFVVGCEDGLVPFRFGNTCADLEEERRLFFVAITRARERLFLCRAKKRTLRGRVVESRPSPFLEDIERDLLQAAGLPERKRRDGPRQLDLFGG